VLPELLRSTFRRAAALIAVLLTAGTAHAAGDLPPLHSYQPPLFTADVSVAIDSTARSSVDVTFTIPYVELNWNKLARGFAAGAGFSVVFEPQDRRRLFGDSWEKRLLVESFDATRNVRNQLVVRRSFEMPAGRYRVRVRVRDVSSELESEAQDVLELEDLTKVPVGFSDLQLGLSDSASRFTPVPTRQFSDGAEGLTARVVLLDRRPGEWPRRARLHWRIAEPTGEVLQQGDTTLTLQQPAQAVELHPPSSELFIGDYLFEVERVEGKSRWRTSRAFEVDESGPPKGKEFAAMLEALYYIGESAEVDAMKNLPPDQQAEAWDRFWTRRDPTPDTPVNENLIEFYRRLRYATRHFQGIGPGWRSDMGRIYIRYGPPDQIESQPGSATSPTVEIWYYHQPYHRFVFVDREGFGRYTLLNPGSE
jgi:GWxTD domain-containing protein